jgi:hypothetical protein
MFSLYIVGLPDVDSMPKRGLSKIWGRIIKFYIDMNASVINSVKDRMLTSVHRGII